jgi:hypothetical protein
MLASGIPLSPGQRRLLRAFFDDVDVEAPTIEADRTVDAALADALAGRRIAIYSLMVDAAKRAREILLDLAPGLRVDLHHDHVATAELQTSARTADLVVISADAAKHAATNAIKRHRGRRPIVYAAGKGATSIVRAVERFTIDSIAVTSSTA